MFVFIAGRLVPGIRLALGPQPRNRQNNLDSKLVTHKHKEAEKGGGGVGVKTQKITNKCAGSYAH